MLLNYSPNHNLITRNSRTMLTSKEVEALEVRKYLNWIEHLQVTGMPVLSEEDIWQTLSDGLVLLRLCDHMKKGCVLWQKVNDPATHPFKKMDNCTYLLKVCKELGIPSEGIDSKEIVQAYHKTQLNLLWLLMRQSFIILNGAKNEEEIRLLAKKFEAFSKTTVIDAEVCEIDPLRLILYYGEEGEVFAHFHDEEELNCPKLPSDFDSLVIPNNQLDKTHFAWIRGSAMIELKNKLPKSTPVKRSIENEIDKDSSSNPEMRESLLKARMSPNGCIQHTQPALKHPNLQVMVAVSEETQISLQKPASIRKSFKKTQNMLECNKDRFHRADPPVLAHKPSRGMAADEHEEDEFYLQSTKVDSQTQFLSPQKVTPIQKQNWQISAPLSRGNSLPESGTSSDHASRSMRSGGTDNYHLTQSKRPDSNHNQHVDYNTADITLDLNANIWMLEDQQPEKNWGFGEHISDNGALSDQEPIFANPVQDTSTQLFVSEILEEFDRSHWNKYLEPYVTILRPVSLKKSSRERSNVSKFDPEPYTTNNTSMHLSQKPYYLRMKDQPNLETSQRLSKLHQKFLGSFYHSVYGRVLKRP